MSFSAFPHPSKGEKVDIVGSLIPSFRAQARINSGDCPTDTSDWHRGAKGFDGPDPTTKSPYVWFWTRRDDRVPTPTGTVIDFARWHYQWMINVELATKDRPWFRIEDLRWQQRWDPRSFIDICAEDLHRGDWDANNDTVDFVEPTPVHISGSQIASEFVYTVWLVHGGRYQHRLIAKGSPMRVCRL